MLKKSLLITTLLSALPLAASAAMGGDMGKSYFSFHGAYAFGGSSDVDVSYSGGSTKTDFDDGWAGGIAFGHYATNNLRTEFAIDYRTVDADVLTFNSQTIDLEKYSTNSVVTGMANIYYDLTNDTNFVPYLGLGLGIAHSTERNRNAFAYQGMAGISYKMPYNGAFFFGYRYFGTTEFKDRRFIGSDTNTYTVKNEFRTHNIELGYRFNF